MSGDPFLLRKGRVEGPRKNTGVRAKLYGERSFKEGTSKIPAEVALCKRIFAVLNAEYPGHAWGVEVMMDQGVCKVTIPALLGFNWGYIIHLDILDKKQIIKAGGEILERFKIPRSTVNITAYVEAQGRIPLLGQFRAPDRRLIPA